MLPECVLCGAIVLSQALPAADGHKHKLADSPHGAHTERYVLPPRPLTYSGYSATMGSLATLSGITLKSPRNRY